MVTAEEAAKCKEHHYPNYCDCTVYGIEQRLATLEAKLAKATKALRFYAEEGTWIDCRNDLSDEARNALKELADG